MGEEIHVAPTEKVNHEIDMGDVAIAKQAQDARVTEHSLTLKDVFCHYRSAIGWSFLFSLGVIMAGFDPQLVGTLIAIPRFQHDFGVELDDGSFVVQAKWQSAFNLGVPVGQVLGAFGVGWPLEKFGRRWTLAACCCVTLITVALQTSAQNRPQILIAELINGVVLGAYPVIAPTYISEVTPVVFRGIAAAFVNLSFVIGQLVASGVLAGCQNRDDRWAYDIPFATQLIFPIIILALLPFCPESPWWLVRRGELQKAERSLKRLTNESVDTSMLLAHIQLTTSLEEVETDTATFIDCFKNTDLRRTVICIMVYAIQPLVANFLVIGYAVYFFELAGLEASDSFNLGVGLLGVGFVGTVLSWFLLNQFGRRTIYNQGCSILVVIVLLVGVLDVVPGYGTTNHNVVWAQCSMMVVYNFFYDLTIGPLCFVYLSEVSSAKLRDKTIAIATTINALINVACAVGIPYAINPDQGNLRGKLAFVFFGVSLPCLTWCFLALPETKGRTFEELDIMFQRRVPTRRFTTYKFSEYMEEDEAIANREG
ncbi:sugar porter family MFS transporter [Trichoderma harzianum]|uniref:Sugar porter family MFS transporter n=1 Tax=Trichoderma harzianum TaxID=5544 RepID=A0A0G0A295_TRIHA|nr:sugar porter family MFS transporter [Trichoderma harzianum]